MNPVTEIKILKERIRRMEKAMQLQAKEYERRLDSLNGEAGRLRNMQATYVQKELYDAHNKDTALKHDKDFQNLSEKTAMLQLSLKDMVSIRALWIVSLGIIGLVLSVVQLFMKH